MKYDEKDWEEIEDILNRIPDTWGKSIDCGEGWYVLLANINRKLKFLYPDYEIQQVKEKFGTLRFYCSIPVSLDDEDADRKNMIFSIMMDVVSAAENRSSRTCETCGAWGETRVKNYWYKTLCTDCAIEQGFPTEVEDD